MNLKLQRGISEARQNRKRRISSRFRCFNRRVITIVSLMVSFLFSTAASQLTNLFPSHIDNVDQDFYELVDESSCYDGDMSSRC